MFKRLLRKALVEALVTIAAGAANALADPEPKSRRKAASSSSQPPAEEPK